MRPSFAGAARILGCMVLVTSCGGAPARSATPALLPPVPSCEEALAAWESERSLARAPAAESTIDPAEYGAVLNQGSWFQHCEVPDDVTLSVCAAVRDGRPHGVSVDTRPARPGLHDCVARGAMRLRFPRQAAMDLTRTVFLAEGVPPWGPPVVAEEEQARVLDFVRAVGTEPARARGALANIVVAMPGLWQRLTATDPALDALGVEAVMLKDDQEISMRTLLEEQQIASLLASPAFTRLSTELARGQTRPATVAERQKTWELQATDFLPDTPITIAEAGELRVAFLVAQGRIWWMEVLSDPALSPFSAMP